MDERVRRQRISVRPCRSEGRREAGRPRLRDPGRSSWRRSSSVFAFQAAGYAPCELCLKERLALLCQPRHSRLATIAAGMARTPSGQPSQIGVRNALAILFLGSCGFGLYHAGVEWGFWPGPTDCTGSPLPAPSSTADFLRDLQSVRVVRCDAAAIRVFGVSMAGWNAAVSLGCRRSSLVGRPHSRPIDPSYSAGARASIDSAWTLFGPISSARSALIVRCRIDPALAR